MAELYAPYNFIWDGERWHGKCLQVHLSVPSAQEDPSDTVERLFGHLDYDSNERPIGDDYFSEYYCYDVCVYCGDLMDPEHPLHEDPHCGHDQN